MILNDIKSDLECDIRTKLYQGVAFMMQTWANFSFGTRVALLN